MPTALRSAKPLSPKEKCKCNSLFIINSSPASGEEKPTLTKSFASKKRACTKRKHEIGAKLDADAAHEKETVSRVNERYAKRKRRRSEDDDGGELSFKTTLCIQQTLSFQISIAMSDLYCATVACTIRTISKMLSRTQLRRRYKGQQGPRVTACPHHGHVACARRDLVSSHQRNLHNSSKFPGADMLGDLFGPYFMHVQAPRNAWPPFIIKSAVNSDQVKQSKQLYTELWFHGECLLWTPKLCIVGTKLHNETSALGASWSQVKSTAKYTHKSTLRRRVPHVAQ